MEGKGRDMAMGTENNNYEASELFDVRPQWPEN